MPFLTTSIGHPLEDSETYPDSPLTSPTGQRIEATNLGEAVAVAAGIFGVRIVPHDPPKWFRVYGIPDTPFEYRVVDIHIKRGDEVICPKQDLSFPLLDADIVSIGMRAC
jgi:hypothetical protein